MTPSPILIAGAGLGGLTAALALLKKGIDVDLYEQAPELGEFGAGIQVSANAARVLTELGLGDGLERHGVKTGARETRLWNTGRSWPAMKLGASAVQTYGFHHYTIHRADLQGMLIAAVEHEKPGAIHRGSRGSAFHQSGEGVTLELEDGRTVQGALLVGADGIHSMVRNRLFGADRPRFTGCMAWRGLAPADRLPDTFRTRVSQWVSPHGHLIQYPVRGGTLINMIGVLERDDWTIESWSVRGTHAECAADFAGWHEDVQSLIRHIETPFKWALMAREPLQHWSAGRVTLLGDACHPPMPYLAQGAAMAIEDGFILSRCIEAFPLPDPALRAYERARVERTTRMVLATQANLKNLHDPALASPDTASAYIADMNRPDRLRERYDWLYGYDALNVPLDPGPPPTR